MTSSINFGKKSNKAVFKFRLECSLIHHNTQVSSAARCCSGSGAPRIALKEMGLWLHEVFSCDPKPEVEALARARGEAPEFHYNTAANLAAAGCGHKIDLFICGFPCPPFSNQRPGRFRTGWKLHRDTSTMYDMATCIRKLKPPVCVLENVPGFMKASRPAFTNIGACLFDHYTIVYYTTMGPCSS